MKKFLTVTLVLGLFGTFMGPALATDRKSVV